MACRGICVKYETRPFSGNKIRSDGYKKCSICRVRIKYSKLNCPCCGRRLSLRTKRNPKSE